ncbi:MAG: hypothetical protein HYY66_11700, partial [Candidatus Tectomicrobia bacterium]|nr:hypothetical protein [Candidatus Tectomicrobia bacterium]
MRPACPLRTTLLALLGLALADGRPAPAHHMNVVQCVFRRGGEAKAGPFDVVLTASQPEPASKGGKTLSPAEAHKLLDKFAHRFKAEI